MEHTATRRLPPVLACWITLLSVLLSGSPSSYAAETQIRYFPSGPIYEYRWKLLDLVLDHTRAPGEAIRLTPQNADVTQNRAVDLLQSGDLDVIALGTNEERERKLLPIKVDILRGIVGFRLLVIRTEDQPRIARMDEATLRKSMIFGLNSQWADVPIMRANGLRVVTSSTYENLFGMLSERRFDAFPRGLNEAQIELNERKDAYPQLSIEKTKALYFVYPVYFWVNQNHKGLAQRIERGLQLSLADGSFRKLFESYHAKDIDMLRREKRQVIYLTSPTLPPGTEAADPSWWWPEGVAIPR